MDERVSHNLRMRLAIPVALVGACTTAAEPPAWRSEMKYAHFRSGVVATNTLTNLTSETRSLAIRCTHGGKCDPNDTSPRISITTDRGETLFDGATCDWLRYNVPGKHALALAIDGNYVTLEIEKR
jgi:hypothetical protein